MRRFAAADPFLSYRGDIEYNTDMDAVEDIKQRLSIEEVISEYVELRRAGRNWKGLSPFGNERTPSFMVSPEKQIWHDFSSGKGGNMFSFVMEMEGLDFKGALELLARKAGVDLDQYRGQGSPSRGRDKEKLYEVLEWATRFYQTQLKHNRVALEYVLKKRAFSKETVLVWRLGYSPQQGSALLDFLKTKGYSAAEMKAAGLTTQRYNGMGDMFRGRIMIPLADAQGRVIGFTARLLGSDKDAPKYINTPHTLLYDKSHHIFGLHAAKEAIRKQQYAVIAEGNLDVISSHQAGVRQVVATAGTALTLGQLKTLGRFTSDIRLCFDADAAGLAATERSLPIAAAANVSLSILTIPSGKDPDELVRQDPKAWEQVVTSPIYAMDWIIQRYTTLLDLSTAQGKKRFSDKVAETIRTLPDKVEQEHYIETVAKLIGVSSQALAGKVATPSSAGPRRLKKPKAPLAPVSKVTTDYLKSQNHLLALALMYPPHRRFLEPLTEDMFQSGNARELFRFLRTQRDTAATGALDGSLKTLADYGKMLALHYEMLYQDIEPHELEYVVTTERAKLVSQYVKTKKQQLLHEFSANGAEADTKLLSNVKELDMLLKLYKGSTHA